MFDKTLTLCNQHLLVLQSAWNRNIFERIVEVKRLHFDTCNFYTKERSRQSAFVEGEFEQLLLVEVNSSQHQRMEIDNKKQPRIKITYLLIAEHYVSCYMSITIGNISIGKGSGS